MIPVGTSEYAADGLTVSDVVTDVVGVGVPTVVVPTVVGDRVSDVVVGVGVPIGLTLVEPPVVGNGVPDVVVVME